MRTKNSWIGRAVCVVEDDEVYVAREVELAAAELAHGKDDEPRPGARPLGHGHEQHAFARRLRQQMVDRVTDRGLGEAAQRRGDRRPIPGAGDVGQTDHQRHLPAGESERAHQRRLVRACGSCVRLERGEQLVEHRPGAAAEHVREGGGVAQRALTEKRRVAEQGVQHRAPGLAVGEAGEGGACLATPVVETARGGIRIAGSGQRADARMAGQGHGAVTKISRPARIVQVMRRRLCREPVARATTLSR
jgi:hypothetical protein